MNIIILAAGPPKKDRQRHLEKFDNEILIDKLIKSCTFENINLYIVIHKENIKLIDNVKKFNNVGILNVDDEYIYTTIAKALSVTGDCILVVGDLIDVEKKDIKKFIDTEHNCSLCRYKCKWGPDIKKNGFLRRSDIGDCIVKISEKYKKEYLSKELWDKAKYYLRKFYPNMKNIDMKSWNWIMTNVNYAFFFNIWGNKDVNSYKDFGTIYFEKKIYSDND